MEEVQGCHCIRGGQEQLSALNRRSRRSEQGSLGKEEGCGKPGGKRGWKVGQDLGLYPGAPDASEELRAEALISLMC